eukprot:586589-Pyramimonas_sp.AAC.1
MYVLALDSKQAFDSVNISAMLAALERFCVPTFVLEVIQSIYRDRTFVVRDKGSMSKEKGQRSGISQGFPLPPFLFVMVMSVMMHDAEAALQPARPGQFRQLVYADDALLMARTVADIQKWLTA